MINVSDIVKPNSGYTYQDTLATSLRVNWRIEDIIGGEKRLDFTRAFMPESLAKVHSLTFLADEEQRTLNQIRGNTYLYVFGLAEEFVVPFVMDHTRPQVNSDDYRVRALLQFIAEEAKHIHLFRTFAQEFQKGFGIRCAAIGPASEIGKTILAHSPLSIALIILQIEWMTQRHYIESVKDDQNLDNQFKSMLRHHWIEEAQHTKLDTLMVEAITESMTEDEINDAIDEYFEIGRFLDDGLRQQVDFDLESFESATGRNLSRSERNKFIEAQQRANRWTYLGSGMTHQQFLGTLERLSPQARPRVEEAAPNFC